MEKVAHGREILHMEVAREGNRIKLCVYEEEPGQVTSIQQYEETNVSMERIDSRCREIIETLNKVNGRGLVSRENLARLREIGQIFSDELLTLTVKEKLRDSRAEHLVMHLDDQLVHVPWELLFDGRHFLCRRFGMGRLVKTRQTVSKGMARVLARPLKMLVLADPRGDLKGAYNEGIWIRDTMDLHKDWVNATLRSGDLTPDFIKQKIRNFDLIHFAGHSDYDPRNPAESGWRLSGGSLKAADVKKMAGTGPMPALIFSNACQSARTEEWGLRESSQEEIFGLANGFLLSGVKHFVGTFWEILDEPSSRFASEFYKCFLSGMTMGEAVRGARHTIIQEYGEENMVWASYLLYGDPTSNYRDQIEGGTPWERFEPVFTDPPGGAPSNDIRGPRPHDVTQGEKGPKRRSGWMALAAGILMIAAVLLWGYPGFLLLDTATSRREAAAYHRQGDFHKALNACPTLDQRVSAFRKEIEKRADMSLDGEKRARIDRMIRELVETMTPEPPSDQRDHWTSKPLTLWVTEFGIPGHSQQEGKEKFLMAGIQDQLIQHGRVRVVERALLDKLLEELKLGTSQLADKGTMLSLGRILAARLVLVGKAIYSGSRLRVSMRLIETETGRIAAAINETFLAAVPASTLSKKLSENLLIKLNEAYPLRGKIVKVNGDEVELNIGHLAGIRKGRRFGVVGEDARLEVVSEQPERAFARVIGGNPRLTDGMRVEAASD